MLQDSVKESIQLLRGAGIKVWMLTGDKMETARCISVSTGLLSPKDHIWMLDRITNGGEMKAKCSEYLGQYKKGKVVWDDPEFFPFDRRDQPDRGDKT